MSIYKPTQDELISCFNDTVNLSLTDNDIKENSVKQEFDINGNGNEN